MEILAYSVALLLYRRSRICVGSPVYVYAEELLP